MESFTVVFMTTSNREEATRIVSQLLNERLIACANIIGPVFSLFKWKEKVEESNEFLVLMKSRKDLFKRLSTRIKEMHGYEVPEIIALPIIEASQHYIDWLKASIESMSKDD